MCSVSGCLDMAAAVPTQVMLYKSQCSYCLKYLNDPVAINCSICTKSQKYSICRPCIDRCDLDAGFLCPPCYKRNLNPRPHWKSLVGLTLCENHGKKGKPTASKAPDDVCADCREKALMVYAAAKRTMSTFKTVKFRRPEDLMKHFKVLVTLDPDTAHKSLTVFEDGKRVICQDRDPVPPDNPKRFLSSVSQCVLGKESFTSGRHYWEVELLRNHGGWAIGVARGSVDRKKPVDEEPEAGVWVVAFSGEYVAQINFCYLNGLKLHEEPKKLGVYMDYEGGWLSVYNADTMEHIYTFTCVDFTGCGKVYPYFRLRKRLTDLRLV